MKEIPLSQGMVALVDDEDYEDLMQFKWCAFRVGNAFYAMRRAYRNGKWTSERLHRRIMNAQPGESVDHINHNGLDCRRENLRLCAHSENLCNQVKQKRETSSRFKGACWNKRNGKWMSVIKRNGKQVYLGYFATDEEAARAYDEAAKRLFGEFALLNFNNHTEVASC